MILQRCRICIRYPAVLGSVQQGFRSKGRYIAVHPSRGKVDADVLPSCVRAQQAGGLAAVKQVQVRSSGGSGGFQSLTNKWGSDWEMANAPSFPLDINIVGADSESVRLVNPLLHNLA